MTCALRTGICATDAYQRASTFDRANTSDDPANGAPPLFSRLYLKPLSAEALYDSLMVATNGCGTSSLRRLFELLFASIFMVGFLSSDGVK